MSTKLVQSVQQSYLYIRIHRRAWRIIKMEGGTNDVQEVVKQVSKFDAKKADDFEMVFQAPRLPITLK